MGNSKTKEKSTSEQALGLQDLFKDEFKDIY